MSGSTLELRRTDLAERRVASPLFIEHFAVVEQDIRPPPRRSRRLRLAHRYLDPANLAASLDAVYVKFDLELDEEPTFTVSDGMFVMANVSDLDTRCARLNRRVLDLHLHGRPPLGLEWREIPQMTRLGDVVGISTRGLLCCRREQEVARGP